MMGDGVIDIKSVRSAVETQASPLARDRPEKSGFVSALLQLRPPSFRGAAAGATV